MTDKRKQAARILQERTGRSYQGCINLLEKKRVLGLSLDEAVVQLLEEHDAWLAKETP